MAGRFAEYGDVPQERRPSDRVSFLLLGAVAGGQSLNGRGCLAHLTHSRSNNSSRRIERLRIGKYVRPDVLVDRAASHQITWTAEDRGELILEVEETEPQPGLRLEDVQEVDVAAGRSSPRANEPKTSSEATP